MHLTQIALLTIIFVLIITISSATQQIKAVICKEGQSVYQCQLRSLRQQEDKLSNNNYMEFESGFFKVKIKLRNSNNDHGALSKLTISMLNLINFETFKAVLFDFDLHKDKTNAQIFKQIKEQHDKWIVVEQNGHSPIFRSNHPKNDYIRVKVQQVQIKYRLKNEDENDNEKKMENVKRSDDDLKQIEVQVNNKRMEQLQRRLKILQFYQYNDLKKWSYFQFTKNRQSVMMTKVRQNYRYNYFINAIPILHGTKAKFIIKEHKSSINGYKIGIGINTAYQSTYTQYKSLINYWSLGFIQRDGSNEAQKVKKVKKGGWIQMQVDRMNKSISWRIDGQLIKQEAIDCYTEYEFFLMIQIKDQWDKLQFNIVS